MVNAFYQYVAVLSANITTFVYAISYGWMSIAQNLYETDKSPLPSGRLSLDEVAWVGSFLGIGGIAGTLAIGSLAGRIGRKHSIILLAVPQILSFIFIIYAQNVNYLYASRFLSGFVGGGSGVVIPVMVTEIGEDRIRGRLGTLLMLAATSGNLVGLLGAHFFDYFTTPRLCLLLSILFIVTYSRMPETPYFLMKMGRIKDAEISLHFYRNALPNENKDKKFANELLALRYSNPQKHADKCSDEAVTIRDFLNEPFKICCILIVCRVLCGELVMLNYTHMIFSKSSSMFSPNVSSIIVGTILVIGSYTSTLFVDRLGRKLLMVSSFAGSAVCLTILATFMYISAATKANVDGFNWIPIVSFSGMIFIASCGAMPVPYIVIGEILSNKVRSTGITFCVCLSWGVTSLTIRSFPTLLALFELYGCIYLFALGSLAAVAYISVAVPETKGKSLENILTILKAK